MARSAWSSACDLLTSELPRYSHRPWEDCNLHEVAEQLGVQWGMVWVPQGETVLGKMAGQWLRHTLMALAQKRKAQTPLSWRQCAKTSMLLEISCFLVRKFGENIPPDFTRSVLKERWQLCRCVPVGKLKSAPHRFILKVRKKWMHVLIVMKRKRVASVHLLVMGIVF